MRRRTVAGIAAAAVAVALVAGVSIAWPGLDAQETPEVDTSVWALQTGAGLRYARVNTAIGELDTVRGVSNPSQVVHSGDAAFVYTDSYSKLAQIDQSLPVDLDSTALEAAVPTPSGTREAVTAGDFAAYLTDAGTVFVGHLSAGGTAQVDPLAGDAEDEDSPQYTADAIAVDDRGMLYAYSAADAAVLRYDIDAGEVRGRDRLDIDVDAPLISAAGDAWVVVDPDGGSAWVRGTDGARDLALDAPVEISEAASEGSAVYVAHDSGLLRVPVDGGAVTDALDGAAVAGVPAPPVRHDGVMYAAWLRSGTTGGMLWSSQAGEVTALSYGAQALGEDRRPLFVGTAEALILNDTRSGWVWAVPDGSLVPSSQNWTLDDRTDPESVPSDEQLDVVIEPKPPIAEPDAFGVRAGRLSTLPVLMNDHDPNEDVLSVDPESVTGLDPGFGTVTLTDDGQRLAVRVEPTATGSAAFQYAVTDGTAADGLMSTATTVTLTVSTGDAAPQWCGVQDCLVPWPAPEVERGGTVTVPVLPGWVDPDGDPLLLLSVDNPSAVGSVVATPAGELVYQHSDDGSGGEQLIDLGVTVSDTTGRVTTRPLVVRVSPDPALTVQSFAVVDRVGAGITVDVAPHLTGTAGTMSVSSVRVLDDAEATASVVAGTTSFDFSTAEPGSFRVGFTVTDGKAEATGTARITVLPADAPAQLATSPVVAFVHPQEDATLDVFAAVSNPTRRVLLLSDVVATADGQATLSVDAVGQNNLRVSGSTASGNAGRLGVVTYTVSDGTEDEGSRVSGEATVYLLPPAPEIAPIAVDDTVVVRAGSQIDIPVLDNDLSPAGGRPTIDPASVASTTGRALAFSSGGVVRYLAPEDPGRYGIDYSVYTTGSPSLADTAQVKVSVLPADTNRAPLPDRLEGRVLSGGSTTIDFDGFGMDPDGDVVTLDRIVSQPERGAAAISADGESIVYTSVPGDRGQVTFRYRVVDDAGATGEGAVRVGVLDAQSNPSPITYTDYVQVQAGSGHTIRVSPLANDVDPTQGVLGLTGVRPDLPATLADGTDNPEYARLTSLIASQTRAEVVITAGAAPGTMSFLYDVESDSGNTGRGLIVVKVVRESVPDYPVVGDTLLSVENRDDFTTGVDVLSGKATWAAGDVSDLEVGLWGDPDDVFVDGRELRGELPEKTRLIPFEITGMAGQTPVRTYAFLRVPGDDDLALALRAGVQPQQVTELESVSFDMASLVALPRGADLEVGPDVRASGSRAGSTCAVDAGTRVSYASGPGAPWTDACQVPVRLAGTDEWTYLSVPVWITALDPQPELRAASLTVGPGETVTYDLQSMTTWQLGRENWDAVKYRVDYTGAGFTVRQDGSSVTIVGDDRAVPASENAATVHITSHDAVVPARLLLRVGAAPSALPHGGSVMQQCSQASGASCSMTVSGVGGEVNPLPRTPLEVVDVRPTGVCVGVSFRVVSPSSVAASWTADAPGATCTASFSVRDAQGRSTAGERDGRILFDLQGFPKAPASLRQTAYGDGAVTLRVDPGESRLAYPALAGFVIRSDGAEVVRCSADGVCPVIPARNGEERRYEAWAVNGVGESRTSVRTTAWAYQPPAVPTAIEWAPVVTGADGAEGNVISISIGQVDGSGTGFLRIASAAGESRDVPVPADGDSVQVASFRVGTNSQTPVTITPYSRFALPPGLGGAESGGTATIYANGVGAPLNVTLALNSFSEGDGTSRVEAVATARANGSGSQLRYDIVRHGASCTDVRPGGNAETFTGLEDGETHRFAVCAESWYDGERYGRQSATADVQAAQSRQAPQGYAFRVDPAPVPDGRAASWRITAPPASDEEPPRFNSVHFTNWGPGSSVYGRDPEIGVFYQHDLWGTQSETAPVPPASGSAPYQVNARWGLEPCQGGGRLLTTGESSNGEGAFGWNFDTVRYRDASNTPIPLADGADARNVPADAASVEGIRVSVSWPGAWGLHPSSDTFGGPCTPVPPGAGGGTGP